MFLWLFLITVCVRPSLQTSRSPHGSTASSFRRRQILLVGRSRVEVGGREGDNAKILWWFDYFVQRRSEETEREGLWLREDVDMCLNLLCFCLLPGRSWAHTASAEPYRGWSSATARRDSVSIFPSTLLTSESLLTAPPSAAAQHQKMLRSPVTTRWRASTAWKPGSFLTGAHLCVFTGVKIIGGYRELTGEEFGIYIKRVIAGGLAALDGSYSSGIFCGSVTTDTVIVPHFAFSPSVCLSLSVPGRLKSGDLILDVNNISLIGVTNERWVSLLRYFRKCSMAVSHHLFICTVWIVKLHGLQSVGVHHTLCECCTWNFAASTSALRSSTCWHFWVKMTIFGQEGGVLSATLSNSVQFYSYSNNLQHQSPQCSLVYKLRN